LARGHLGISYRLYEPPSTCSRAQCNIGLILYCLSIPCLYNIN
jgi:hypothetical protein